MIEIILTFLFVGDATANTRLPVGTVIEAVHVSGADEEVDPLLGRQTTKTIFPGRIVTLADTREADLVSRNGIVRILARKGVLTVETKGRALGAGAAGDEILVINLESRRTLTATIVGPGIVEVSI